MSMVWEDQGGASSCGHDIISIIPLQFYKKSIRRLRTLSENRRNGK